MVLITLNTDPMLGQPTFTLFKLIGQSLLEQLQKAQNNLNKIINAWLKDISANFNDFGSGKNY